MPFCKKSPDFKWYISLDRFVFLEISSFFEWYHYSRPFLLTFRSSDLIGLTSFCFKFLFICLQKQIEVAPSIPLACFVLERDNEILMKFFFFADKEKKSLSTRICVIPSCQGDSIIFHNDNVLQLQGMVLTHPTFC